MTKERASHTSRRVIEVEHLPVKASAMRMHEITAVRRAKYILVIHHSTVDSA